MEAEIGPTPSIDVADVIDDADLLYVTRVQEEYFSDLAQYEDVKDHYEITTELMRKAKKKMVIMHPLPRLGQINYAVDNDPGAAYSARCKTGCRSAWPCRPPYEAWPRNGTSTSSPNRSLTWYPLPYSTPNQSH